MKGFYLNILCIFLNKKEWFSFIMKVVSVYNIRFNNDNLTLLVLTALFYRFKNNPDSFAENRVLKFSLV